eukprot:899677-Pyramimonas_sp.AAC.1
MEFWCDSGSSRRNRQVDLRRWSPQNHVLACFRVLTWLSSARQLTQWTLTLVGCCEEGAWSEGLCQYR